MVAQQTNVDAIANNIANVNTTGFKKSRVNFKDLVYETLRPAGAENSAGEVVPEGVQIGHGVKVEAIGKVFTQGNLLQTGIETDVAISGEGFFQVELPSGDIAYTRDGSFRLNANRALVTADGFTGLRPPPYRDGPVALENHTRGEHRRQFHVGESGGSEEQDQEE